MQGSSGQGDLAVALQTRAVRAARLTSVAVTRSTVLAGSRVRCFERQERERLGRHE